MPIQYLRVSFSNGEVYDIPAKFIAEIRSKYYAQKDADAGEGEFSTLFKEEMEYVLNDEYELRDYAANNLNWADIKAVAIKRLANPIDYEEEWSNAEKKTV